MLQIMWETVFDKQFENILDSFGIDKTNTTKIDALKKQLIITRRTSCQLMVEVDEDWKDKLIRILENENSCCR
jgi:hypothetical protein